MIEHTRKSAAGAENLTVEQVEQMFAAAIADAGYGDHHIPADGQWHNFSFPDNSPGHKSGSAKLTFGEEVEGVVDDAREWVVELWVQVDADDGVEARAAVADSCAASPAEQVEELHPAPPVLPPLSRPPSSADRRPHAGRSWSGTRSCGRLGLSSGPRPGPRWTATCDGGAAA